MIGPQTHNMTPERWARIVHLYESALATDSAVRAAFVAEATRDDEALRREVESLLSQDGTPVLIDNPILEVAAVVLEPEATLARNTLLGPYRIQGLIGAGGMGEVYRAHDGKLNRDVALKILPDAFVHDGDRVARFTREAQVLAALNHPNIAAIYGFEDSSDVHALVLELVEGPTLADRIARGPIPVDEALGVARQIAEALEAAHEHGIVHRDLKPANIKIRDDGTVKVLDFGLAKGVSPGAGGGTLTQSPTLSLAATKAGVILGTAAYMSPEQAKGFVADRRSDVFSFGCVLYETLTGRPPFQGETVADVLGAVLVAQPDLQALPANLSSRLVELIRRCLEKNPKRRWQAIGDVRLELETIAAAPLAVAVSAPLAPRQPLWKRVTPIAVTVIIASLLAGAAAWTTAMRAARGSTPPIVTRFAVPLDAGEQFTNTGRQVIAISPDGAQIAYVANTRLRLRSMSDLQARTIPGGDRLPAVTNPVFSPDGGAIAFFSTDQTLKKIDIRSGVIVTLCRASALFGMSWGQRGIVFGQLGSGIMRVAPEGGTPEVLVAVEEGEVAHGPQILPDNDSVLFTLAANMTVRNEPRLLSTQMDAWDKARIVVQSLRSGQRKVLVDGGSDARYLPTGHLVYAVAGVLQAVPFDLSRLEVTGRAVPIVEGVRRAASAATGTNITTATAQFGVSDTGSLAYVPGPVSNIWQLDLALVDRDGAVRSLRIPPRSYQFPRLSPEGRRVAVGSDDGNEAHVWIKDLADGGDSIRQLTFGSRNRFPVWSADGVWVAFQSDREGDRAIFRQRADGTGKAERLTRPEPGTSHIPESWSPDGKHLLFNVISGEIGVGGFLRASRGDNVSLWALSFEDKMVAPFGAVTSSTPLASVFSPDGRWVAYSSTMNEGFDVYVEPFPSTGTRYRVTDNGTSYHPLWSPNGRALFYRPRAAQMSMVTVALQPTARFGTPVDLPRPFVNFGPASPRNYDIAPDGNQFLALIEAEQAASGDTSGPRIQVVLNWFEELNQRVPVR